MRYRGLALAALLLVAAPASSSWAAGQDDALRPEVGKPLQAAQGLIKQKKFKEALAQIKKAEVAAPLSAKETGLLEQLRGIAAAGTGDNPAAIKSFEAAIASGKLAQADQLRLTQTVAGLSYQAKDYPNTVVWVKRYQEAGGSDDATLNLLGQAYYANADWAAAAATLNEQIAAAKKAGRKPTEAQLQLLVNTAGVFAPADARCVSPGAVGRRTVFNQAIHRCGGTGAGGRATRRGQGPARSGLRQQGARRWPGGRTAEAAARPG
jgi:tetratricopeptide (TPR) repeat protein